MQPQVNAPGILGNELRYGRIASHKRQRDVAAEIGASQSLISRMELGHGSSTPLATWAAAAAAVDCRLVVDIVPSKTRHDSQGGNSLDRRCHRTVVDVARSGGWTALTVVEVRWCREIVETLLTRRTELVVVHVWDLVTDVRAGIDRLQASLERERLRDAVGLQIAGLVVVPSGLGNRRRMTEAREQLASELPAVAAHWSKALRRADEPTPRKSGVLWVDGTGHRLLPAPLLPGWAWVTPDHGSAALRRRPA